MAPANDARVLLLHNRYRVTGGEERSLELQRSAFERAGVPVALLERSSSDVRRARAAAALLRGGERPDEVAAAVRGHRATVVHAHNTLPLIGARGLAAARSEGARVVAHLHNVRLFCAPGFGERDGGPCFRCHGRFTLPGLVLDCRRSLPESLAYTASLSLHQPRVVEAVDRFVTPSSWAAGQVVKLGLPADRVQVIRHALPAGAFAERSRAGDGTYALVVSRLSPEKGIDAAIAAAAAAGMPLRVAGDGPDRERLEGVARGHAEFLGLVDAPGVRDLLDGAAALVMPSRYHEFSPYSALEAMARGVPVVATAMGGLPELLSPEACVARLDQDALSARLAVLWEDAGARAVEGERLLARARERHGEERWVAELLELYARLAG